MAIRNSRFYNNPQIGAAFDNLAQMFGPPSGSDTLGYVSAAAKKAEADRLASLFTMAQAPNFDQSVFDRSNIAVGNYAPTSSFYAQDQNDATTRRGDDLTAQTSRANNTADNQRSFLASMFGEVSQDAMRPAVPGDIAGFYGAPQGLPAIQGNVSPPSETEVMGQIIAGLEPQDQQAMALSDIPVEQILGGEGQPVFARRNDAVGQQAFVNPGATAKPTNGMAILPDGRRVAVVQAPGSTQWVEAQTGTPVPAGVEVFDMSKQEGGPGDFDATTANQTEATRLEAGIAAIEQNVTGIEEMLRQNPGIAGAPGSVIGAAQNVGQTLTEITQAFGDKAPDAAVTVGEITTALQAFAPKYDGNIQRLRTRLAELAYQVAQINNPSGEVSRQAYERALESFTGGVFQNNASVLAGLQGVRDGIAHARTRVNGLRNPGSAAPPPADETATPRPRAVNPATGEKVEWDGAAWVPVQ